MKDIRRMETSLGEVRQLAIKYVEAILTVMEKDSKTCSDNSILQACKHVLSLGYAIGVVAGKLSNCGVEGFLLVLNGIRISIIGEKRKEKIQYAVWDMNGDLHTSEEGTKMEEGGEPC